MAEINAASSPTWRGEYKRVAPAQNTSPSADVVTVFAMSAHAVAARDAPGSTGARRGVDGADRLDVGRVPAGDSAPVEVGSNVGAVIPARR